MALRPRTIVGFAAALGAAAVVALAGCKGPACVRHSDCAIGFACGSGECQVPEVVVEAAPDATAPDASTRAPRLPDASVGEPALDAGVADAGDADAHIIE